MTEFQVDAVLVALRFSCGRRAVGFDLAREGRNHNRLARVREGVVVPRHT